MSPLCAPRAAAPSAWLHLNRSGRAALPAPGRLRGSAGAFISLGISQYLWPRQENEPILAPCSPLTPVLPPRSALWPRRCRWLIPFGFSDTAPTPTLSPLAARDDGHRGSPAPEPPTDGGCQGFVVPGLRSGRAVPRDAAGRAPGAGQAEHPGQTPLASQAQRPAAPVPRGSADRAPQDASAALRHGRRLPRDAPGRPRPPPARDGATGIRDSELC